MLLGREHERQEIERVLDHARAGRSAVLGLVGEAGIGKTALLDLAAELGDDLQVLRARGVQSEAEIPFAALLELLRPALGALDQLPAPQAQALEEALALRPGSAQDRFAVGAATLSLLAAHGEEGPMAVLVDDAQWLDSASAQALLFAVRRLLADPIAVLIAVREGEPSLLDEARLPALRLRGLTPGEAATLLPGVPEAAAARLHTATAGNPLALLELSGDAEALVLAPAGAPVIVSARIVDAFLRRAQTLAPTVRGPLLLAAASDTGDLTLLTRAADHLGLDLGALTAAEVAGLISFASGVLEFRHPLARSAIYADATAEDRRAAHRALAGALPDRDLDRRAWHLASAALGPDEVASSALAQAGARARERSAYVTAAAAFERAAQLAGADEPRARLYLDAARTAWLGGQPDNALRFIASGRGCASRRLTLAELDYLEGHIAVWRGPILRGYAVLTAGAEAAEPELALTMLAEAAAACFYTAKPPEMLAAAQRAHELLSEQTSIRAQVVAHVALGMAHTMGGDAALGADALRHAVALTEANPSLADDIELLPWLALTPIFLREATAGRGLLEHVVRAARSRTALGVLPFLLNLIARDQATSDRWAVAEATYREAIDLAREGGQQTALVFALAGLAWLQARRGRTAECRAATEEVLALTASTDTHLHQIWAMWALGELELAAGDPAAAVAHLEAVTQLLRERSLTDADLSPAPELVDAYLRLGRVQEAERVATAFMTAAQAKAQPWSLARAYRARGMVAAEDEFADAFAVAMEQHARTLDDFETARTQLAYGERLRRARNRALAREPLRAALETFERLDASPWAERARTELAATGESVRRRDPTAVDELTPQELQIALLLAGGKTTREAAATLFLSPKTVEYHLRHVYLKLGIHSREELTEALAAEPRPAPAAAIGA